MAKAKQNIKLSSTINDINSVSDYSAYLNKHLASKQKTQASWKAQVDTAINLGLEFYVGKGSFNTMILVNLINWIYEYSRSRALQASAIKKIKSCVALDKILFVKKSKTKVLKITKKKSANDLNKSVLAISVYDKQFKVTPTKKKPVKTDKADKFITEMFKNFDKLTNAELEQLIKDRIAQREADIKALESEAKNSQK